MKLAQPFAVRSVQDAQRQLRQLYQALNKQLNGDNVILTHAETTGQTADDHHNELHSLTSHTTKKHAELTDVLSADHHTRPVDNELYGKLLTGLAADIPAAGTVDRWYYATDTKVLYYDDGAAWAVAATSSGGTAIRTWTQTSVLDDFSLWTLSSCALNANKEIELALI